MTKTILSTEIPAENLVLVAYNPHKAYYSEYDHVYLQVMYYCPERGDYYFARNDWKFPGLEDFHITSQMADIFGIASDEVVHPYNIMPFCQKVITEMGAKKASRAGNKNSHKFLFISWKDFSNRYD